MDVTDELAVQRDEPDPEQDVYWIKTHGGLGDIIWVHCAMMNAGLPLHISISNENRSRPRRSADLVRHLPNVVSWNYDSTAFCPDTGADWPKPGDPCSAIGKKFSELGIRPNVKTRLECNAWLEGGRRIEDWLPDLPKTHHYDFRPCGPPTLNLQRPYIILHVAGWPDVPDAVWVSAVDLFRTKCHVYIVGGSYDHRPRRIYDTSKRCMPGVTLVEDTSWENVMGLLKGCSFCFGHASGFTALGNVLRVPGVVFNPRTVPRLIGTWNSLDHKSMIHVDKVSEFESAIGDAYNVLSSNGKSTWPSTAPAGAKLSIFKGSTGSVGARVVKAACMGGARSALVWALGNFTPDDIPAAVLDGVYSGGKIIRRLDIVGFDEPALSKVYRETTRSTSRPVVDVFMEWPPDEHVEGYELAVICSSERPVESANAVRQVWSRLSSNGTLLIGGPSAKAASESLAAALRATAAAVESADGWFYLHRRM